MSAGPGDAGPGDAGPGDARSGAGRGGLRLVVVTGLSGAGRTTAAKVLEDLGWFVIDNMPPGLMTRVVDLATVGGAPGDGAAVDRIALVADVRGRALYGDLLSGLDALRERGLDPRVLFLEADEQVLVNRYTAARRAHPLAGPDRVVDGIARERALLAEVRAVADLVVDTTSTNVHTLRDRLVDAFGNGRQGALAAHVLSFGYKHGTPRDADMLLDVRFLPNPHWVPDLRPRTGLDAPVRDYVLAQPATQRFLERLRALLDVVVPGFVDEGRRYLTVGVGCTGGRHRSVVLAEEVAAHLRGLGVDAAVEHRDRTRD